MLCGCLLSSPEGNHQVLGWVWLPLCQLEPASIQWATLQAPESYGNPNHHPVWWAGGRNLLLTLHHSPWAFFLFPLAGLLTWLTFMDFWSHWGWVCLVMALGAQSWCYVKSHLSLLNEVDGVLAKPHLVWYHIVNGASDDWASILFEEVERLGTLRIHNIKWLFLLESLRITVLQGRQGCSLSKDLCMESWEHLCLGNLLIDTVSGHDWCLWGCFLCHRFVSEVANPPLPAEFCGKRLPWHLGLLHEPWSWAGPVSTCSNKEIVGIFSLPHCIPSTLWANNLLCILRSVLISSCLCLAANNKCSGSKNRCLSCSEY